MSQHLCFNPYNRTFDNGNSNVVLSFKLPVSITILEICTQIHIESDKNKSEKYVEILWWNRLNNELCFDNGDRLWF